MRKRLRAIRNDRRLIIITFAVLESLMLLGFVLLGAWLDQSVTLQTQVWAREPNAVLQIETLAPDKILWGQNAPISITLWLRCLQDCSHTTTSRETVLGPGGEWITRTTTTTLTATATQSITRTIQTLAGGSPRQETITATIAPLWVHGNGQIWIARADNPEWQPQLAISPTVNGPGEALLVRRVQPADPAIASQKLQGTSLPIELESKAAAFVRLASSKFIELGPIAFTILITAVGIWLDYQRQRAEQSREKLEALQKLSQEKSRNIDLLEAFMVHWPRVPADAGDLLADYAQLRKKILDPPRLLTTLSEAYERSPADGEDLLGKLVAFYRAEKTRAQKENLPDTQGALQQNLERLSQLQAEENPPLEKLKLVFEIWQDYQVPAHLLAVYKILEIWQQLDDTEKNFTVGESLWTDRSQLYLSPVLEELRGELLRKPWYDQVFPFQDGFAPSPMVLTAAPAAPPRRSFNSAVSAILDGELERQKALIELLKRGNPFNDLRSLVGQRTRLQEGTWVPPRNWQELVKNRGLNQEQHLLYFSDEAWDVHAALCLYASDLSLAEKNRAFMVPLNLPAFWTAQDEKQPILQSVLTALAGGWAALLAAQPVAFLNLSASEQVLLLELGSWAAGSFAAWESWLAQKAQAYQLVQKNQLMRQLSNHMQTLTAQVRLPADPERLPAQAPRWLALRPAQLWKTYLVFTLPDLYQVAEHRAVPHRGLQTLLQFSPALAQQHIYLRGFVQQGYLDSGEIHPTPAPLSWDENNLLSALETRFRIFCETMKPEKPLQHFGNLFTPYSPMADYQGRPYPQADYRLVALAKGSLGRLVFLGQALLRTLTEDDQLYYLEEKHLDALERNTPHEPTA